MADDGCARATSSNSRAGRARGTQLKTPRPVVLVDSREQNPFDFSRFDGWFAGIEKKPLKLGDYSVAGLEDVCVVERKDLPDLIHSLNAERSVFVSRLVVCDS
jgi:ERCC4-type nuclease